MIAIRGQRVVWAAALVLALLITGGALLLWNRATDRWEEQNDRYNSPSMKVNAQAMAEPVTADVAVDFFAEYRLERERIESERADYLQASLRQASSEQGIRQAQQAVWQMMDIKEKQTDIEGLIKAHGFGDALVFIKENSAYIIVKAAALSREEVTQIGDIVMRISGIGAENITITAKP